MSAHYRSTAGYLEKLLRAQERDELLRRLEPKPDDPAPRCPGTAKLTAARVKKFWARLAVVPETRDCLADPWSYDHLAEFQGNIENFIGTAKIPIGLVGPLRVNGLFAQGDYHVPLATTEAALVASYHRGAQLVSEVGGCTSVLLSEGVSRAPGFAFCDLREAGAFVAWVLAQVEPLQACVASTTRHGRLIDLKVTVEGNHVYLDFEFTTGDAAGQNMVTIATENVCRFILAHSPIAPQYHFVEANLSGDKKASARSFLSVRGKKVTAEVVVPGALLRKRLHTTPLAMERFWRMSALGGVMSGTIGVQGHYANGLAAVYIACGQDAACVAESAVGVTRFEVLAQEAGDALYASVTLPNLVVGTVGGGTGLPTQKACLEILGLSGPGHAQALAEVCAALALAGELSITGALAAGEFARAHQRLARGRKAAASLPKEHKEHDDHRQANP